MRMNPARQVVLEIRFAAELPQLFQHAQLDLTAEIQLILSKHGIVSR